MYPVYQYLNHNLSRTNSYTNFSAHYMSNLGTFCKYNLSQRNNLDTSRDYKTRDEIFPCIDLFIDTYRQLCLGFLTKTIVFKYITTETNEKHINYHIILDRRTNR